MTYPHLPGGYKMVISDRTAESFLLQKDKLRYSTFNIPRIFFIKKFNTFHDEIHEYQRLEAMPRP